MQTISVIIAAYNEERTLSSIVEIVRAWGKAQEIIVVDDGSKDKTSQSVKQFIPDIILIRHTKNQGKAAAIAHGITKSTGDILVLLDADTVGLTHKDLNRITDPVSSGKQDMVLGLARFWSAGKFEPFNALTGQRVLRRIYIEPELPNIQKIGYGLELFINKLYEPYRVISVRLPHVFILGKFEKQKKHEALLSYGKELKDLIVQLFTQYADEIGPHAKRIMKEILRIVLQVIDTIIKS